MEYNGGSMKLSDFTEKMEINKGWSSDKKYCVTDEKGQKYLLRISPLEQYEYKKAEFEGMQKVWELGIPMCEPIEFGTCEEGVYSLQSWIHGEDAREVLPSLGDEQAYNLGLEAGEILKKNHSIPAPSDIDDWEIFFNRKINRKIEMYSNCPLKYENGNLMIDNNGHIVVIDFNREDYGDPWEEFNRIVWCAQSSPMFATGMVDGYFDSNVPMEFWDLLALYISSNALSSLPWAIPFGQEEIDVMVNQAKNILEWYDDMKNTVPKWYKK